MGLAGEATRGFAAFEWAKLIPGRGSNSSSKLKRAEPHALAKNVEVYQVAVEEQQEQHAEQQEQQGNLLQTAQQEGALDGLP